MVILFFVVFFVVAQYDHLEGGSFVVTLFKANLLLFGGLFKNTYRDGFYTLSRCTNLAAKQS